MDLVFSSFGFKTLEPFLHFKLSFFFFFSNPLKSKEIMVAFSSYIVATLLVFFLRLSTKGLGSSYKLFFFFQFSNFFLETQQERKRKK